MRLLISADIEGVAGVVTREQTQPKGYEYTEGRIWMTDMVAAAANTAFEMGVEDVVVVDSHLHGQNIMIDRLPERVTIVRGNPRPLGMVTGVEQGGFDGALFLGYHTSSGHISGILGHTIRGLVVREVRVNDEVVSEASFYHLLLGHFGVPLIGIAGDDHFVDETKSLCGDVESAVLKWSYGHLSARSLMPAAAHKEVAAMTRRAVSRIGSFKPRRIEGPVTLCLTFKHRPPAQVLSLLPGVELIDGYTIRTTLADMQMASNFMTVAMSYNPSEI